MIAGLVQAAQAAARKATKETPRPTRLVGTVQTISGDLATVVMDDGGTIQALVRAKVPAAGTRVEVEFYRGACRVVGQVGGWA